MHVRDLKSCNQRGCASLMEPTCPHIFDNGRHKGDAGVTFYLIDHERHHILWVKARFWPFSGIFGAAPADFAVRKRPFWRN